MKGIKIEINYQEDCWCTSQADSLNHIRRKDPLEAGKYAIWCIERWMEETKP